MGLCLMGSGVSLPVGVRFVRQGIMMEILDVCSKSCVVLGLDAFYWGYVMAS